MSRAERRILEELIQLDRPVAARYLRLIVKEKGCRIGMLRFYFLIGWLEEYRLVKREVRHDLVNVLGLRLPVREYWFSITSAGRMACYLDQDAETVNAL
jgi:hypothetical protein